MSVPGSTGREGMSRPVRAAGLSAAISLLVGLVFLLAPPPPAAQSAPFTCSSSTVFVAQNSPTQLFRQEYGTGSTSFVPVGPVQAITYNALAFNEVDGYLYAMNNSSQGNLLRIHDDGSIESVGTPAGVPATVFLKGAMDPAGNFYIANPGSTAARIVDVSTMTSTALTLSQETNVSDWTYIDGYLWGAQGTVVSRADATTGEVDKFNLPALIPSAYGAAWTYGNGDLGLSNNPTGTVYRIRINDAASANPTFEVVSTAFGPSSGNNDGAACLGLPTDLSVAKTGPGTVEPGSQISWTITITNNGPGDSSGMSVSDTLPAGVSNVSTPTPGCEVVGGQVQCVLGFLPNGDSTEIVINATSPPDPDTCVTNAVEAVANGVDPDPGNNTATHQTCTRPPLADLAIDKVANSDRVQVGGEITYTLTVTNNGPDPAQDVTVSDVAAAGITPLEATPSQGSCASATSCNLGTVASGQTATIQVRAKAETLGILGNTATVDSPTDDPDPSNNTSTTTVEIFPIADVKIRKQASTGRINEGETFFYRLRVTNDGPSMAENVVVSDSMPANVAVRSVTTSRGTCTQSAPVVCNLGNLANGGSVDIRINVTATDAGSTANTSIVTSSTPDPNPSNNQDSSRVETGRSADLGIVKEASTQVPLVGESFQYRLTVTNKGPSRAIDTVVTDAIPNGLRVDGVGTSKGNCSGMRPVVCQLGNLNPGQTVTVTITATALREAPMTNGASVTSDSPDPDPSDNTTNVPVDPAVRADLQLTKTASEATVPVGGNVVYSVVVRNAGPHGAKDVVVTDPVPAGATLVSAASLKGTCAPGDAVLCRIGDLVPGESVSIRIEVTFTEAGSTRNTATVTSPTPDPDPTNNTDETEVTSEKADLEITKRALTRQVRQGGQIRYRLTVRNGGSDAARGVTVTDAVPSSLVARSVQTGAGSCEIVRRAVVCSLGDLAAGASVNVTVTARVVGVGRIRNAASVTADFPSDPNLTNNTSRTNIRVLPGQTRLVVRKRANRRVVSRGNVIRYRIVVRNRGNRTARNVRVCDRISSGLVFTHRGGARLVRGQACWRVAALAPGSQRVFRIAARAVGASGGRLKNRVTATAANARAARAQAAVRKRQTPPTRPGGVTG